MRWQLMGVNLQGAVLGGGGEGGADGSGKAEAAVVPAGEADRCALTFCNCPSI